MSAARGSAGTRAEVARSQPACGRPQPHHRLGQVPREQIANQSRRDNRDNQPRHGHAARPEKHARSRRKSYHHRIAMKSIRGGARIARDRGRGEHKTFVRHPRPAGRHAHRPIRSAAVRNFFTLFVEQIGANVLRLLQILHVLPELSLAALLVGTDGVVQYRRAECLPRGTAWTKGKRDQDGQDNNQRLCHPEREKNSKKQTLHVSL